MWDSYSLWQLSCRPGSPGRRPGQQPSWRSQFPIALRGRWLVVALSNNKSDVCSDLWDVREAPLLTGGPRLSVHGRYKGLVVDKRCEWAGLEAGNWNVIQRGKVQACGRKHCISARWGRRCRLKKCERLPDTDSGVRGSVIVIRCVGHEGDWRVEERMCQHGCGGQDPFPVWECLDRLLRPGHSILSSKFTINHPGSRWTTAQTCTWLGSR